MNFLIVALAVWRIASLLANEEGPFDVFEKFRDLIGVRYDENSERYGTNVVADAFTCVWCLSIWIGFIVAIYQANTVIDWAFRALALSTVAIIIEEMVNDK